MRLRQYTGYIVSAAAAILCGFSAAQQTPDPAALEFFETKIRPILAERCFECHGPDEQKSDLRLDHISTIMTGGERGPAIVPGDPEASRLVEAIEYFDVDFQMPPKEMMSDEEIDLLIEWVEMGAPWPDEPAPADAAPKEGFDLAARRDSHWAWQPVRNPQPPRVENESLAPTDIDRFLVARLEAEGLKPGPETDRRTLIRRLYFDLIGLPPTPEQIDAFLNDTSEDALETAVDALLASPHFGERWGRHWLDLVRYAETYGHEQDYPIREAWRYRDYVIRALNSDVPYDDFAREHIAGDLLPDPRMNMLGGYNESIIGTGWWYMHQATHAPVDVLKDEADRIDNQIDVMTKTFLGMTVACARCHDHKFDAISTKDYYSLTAFLRASRQEFAYLDPFGKIAAKQAKTESVYAQAAEQVRKAAGSAADEAAQQVEAYLLAAREVMHGEPKKTDAPYRETVFADFENGYGAWDAKGAAFGDGPAEGTLDNQNRVDGFEGRFLVNSYRKGDVTKGKLTSPEFIVEEPYIRLLVGGGDDTERTAVHLVVDGENVRTATGRKRERLEPHRWDVREFLGKTAQIQVVDDASGGWGHINVDHIVFTANPFSVPVSRPAAGVANEFGVDEAVLSRWVNLLSAPDTGSDAHPLHAWRRLSAEGDFQEAKSAVISREPTDVDSVLFEDFDNGYDDWFVRGFAFGNRPTLAGEWEPIPAGGGAPVHAGVAHSGLLGPEWQGTIRSKTFTIEHDGIHYRMKGKGGRIRLVIGRYELREYNGILFQNTYVNINSPDYVWRHQVGGLGKFKGAHAYIEIIDDDPNGYVAIDEIRFSDKAPAGAGPPRSLMRALRGKDIADREAAARAYGTWTRDAFGAWQDGNIDAAEADWLKLLVREKLIQSSPLQESVEQGSVRLASAAEEVPAPMRVLTIDDGSVEPAHVFIRGNHTEEGEPVRRRWLAALDGSEPFQIERGSGRLQLAESVTAPDNPLFARVMVNRVWHHLFGEGIVLSVDNFGVLGRDPSHPELLDYLATWFREDGYSLKRLIRKLTLTRAYRLSSKPSGAEAEQRDPANILLHRANVRRLEAEIIRDALLAVSGNLDTQMFGPPVRAYVSPFMTYHRRSFKSGPMDGDGRRTIYLEVRRNFLPEMQLAFDFPLPDTTIGSRTVSNLPAQSLILMNDPFVAEQAKSVGKRMVHVDASVRDRIAMLHEQVLGRPPAIEELDILQDFIETQGKNYMLDIDESARDERVWTDLCRALFMTKEFIFIG